MIVRLSDGTQNSKANAVLVNAHSDSTLPSPGAADDLVGVAVMLEALRVMGMGDRKLTNAVIFRECSESWLAQCGAEPDESALQSLTARRRVYKTHRIVSDRAFDFFHDHAD